MRPSVARNILFLGAMVLAPLSAAYAQIASPPAGYTTPQQYTTGYVGANPNIVAQQQAANTSLQPSPALQQAANAAATSAIDGTRDAYLLAMRQALERGGQPQEGMIQPEIQAPPPDLGDIKDKNSARYKSNKLADQAIRDRNKARDMFDYQTSDIYDTPPAEIETLQLVNEASPATAGIDAADDPVVQELNAGMRKSAMKEAALSYGARGGLAKHSYEIMERIKDYDPALDKVFNFRQLLLKAPSGLMIEPPIVKESLDALVITNDGDEAAVAKQVLDINKRAKIVSAPRDWRQYLIQSWGKVPPPPRVLWPKNEEEQKEWNRWIAQGWKAGVEQAEQIFDMNVNRLVADYSGMVRYKTLVAQGMISVPYAMQEDRGVTGDKNQMRVGDSALRITGPSQFLMGADLWKPADR